MIALVVGGKISWRDFARRLRLRLRRDVCVARAVFLPLGRTVGRGRDVMGGACRLSRQGCYWGYDGQYLHIKSLQESGSKDFYFFMP